MGIVAGGTMNTLSIQTWKVLKIDESRQNIFMGRVGKDGKMMKVNAKNMANVSFSWLTIGLKLKNVSKVN